MIIPYTEQDALAQAPAYYHVGDETVLIYPMRIGDLLRVNGYVRDRYVMQETAGIEHLDSQIKREFIDDFLTKLEGFDFLTGDGQMFFLTDLPSMIYYVKHLMRFPEGWDDQRIQQVFFPKGVGDLAVTRIAEMRIALFCETPPMPQLNITHKEPRYETTKEEQVARIYKKLADSFHWTYQQVLGLTDYQVYWYMHMFPEERQHVEEMDEMANKNGPTGTGSSRVDVPYQPGTLHFNSPEEYEAWLAEKQSK